MIPPPRITGPVQRVLLLFLRNPAWRYYGLEISREAQVGRGTLYPLLDRLENAGWLESEWEELDPAAGRRPRRYYTLTDSGLQQARQVQRDLTAVLAQVTEKPQRVVTNPAPLPKSAPG
jgi:PadR family transcriptional regulator PadR